MVMPRAFSSGACGQAHGAWVCAPQTMVEKCGGWGGMLQVQAVSAQTATLPCPHTRAAGVHALLVLVAPRTLSIWSYASAVVEPPDSASTCMEHSATCRQGTIWSWMHTGHACHVYTIRQRELKMQLLQCIAAAIVSMLALVMAAVSVVFP